MIIPHNLFINLSMSMGHGFSYVEQPEATRHILE